MSQKEKIMQALQGTLPEEAGYAMFIEKLVLLEKLERGLLQAEQGQTITHEEMKNRNRPWLK